MFCMVLFVALAAAACGEPSVPQARSSTAELVSATLVPVPATPTPLPTPTPPTVPEGEPIPTPPPVTQPGLSNTTIRLAVVFDDETQGVADRLFRDAWLGMLAWENEINSNGGLGGRFVQVVPVDSRLFDHRSALELVCQGDFFAIVGSHSLGDSDGAELLGSEACNIADFPGQVYGSRRAASPVTLLSNPFLNDVRQAGPARVLVERFPAAAENLGLLRYFALDLGDETERQREMFFGQGANVVFELPVDLEDDPEDRIVGRWEDSDADSLVWVADPARLIELLEALEEPPSDAVEGVYTWIDHSPFESPYARGDLFVYRANLASVAPEAGWSDIGLQSWMAGRLFEAVFARLIELEPEAPTREQLIQIARETEFWNANGIISDTKPSLRVPSECFVLMVVENGRWVQSHPAPPRDKDCAPENLFPLVTSSSLGVAALSSTTSEDQPVPEAEEVTDIENPEGLDG